MTDSELLAAAQRVTDELDLLAAQVERLRKRGRRTAIGAIVGLIAMFITGSIAAVDARAQDQRQSQRWCELLNTITSPLPTGQPRSPASERQRKTLMQLNELRDQFGCR